MEKLYDMHVATEGNGDSQHLHDKLVQLGFKDDELAERGLVFDQETARHYTSCPLIDIHMSKKITDVEELRVLETNVETLLTNSGLSGYYHSEYVLKDEHVVTSGVLSLRPLPFRRLTSRSREEPKKWDIHVAIREATLPELVKSTLLDNGLYYLARYKGLNKERYAVFTVQGINAVNEGRRFYVALHAWFVSIGGNFEFDIKLEVTTSMQTYNNPRAVPPTIDRVVWC